MGWTLRGKKHYYYRSTRSGNETRREYFGNGPEGRLAASLDAQRRQDRRRRCAELQADRQRWHDAAAIVATLCQKSGLLAHVKLLTAGYRQHQRGEWRKWRLAMNASTDDASADSLAGESMPDLVRRAQQGDASVLPALRRAIDPAVWTSHGDLAGHAKTAWLGLIAGEDHLLREAISTRMVEIEKEMLGPAPTPLEKLLIERVTACYLQALYSDISYPQMRATEVTAAVRKELLHRMEVSNRRLLTSVKTLAVVRQLLPSAHVIPVPATTVLPFRLAAE